VGLLLDRNTATRLIGLAAGGTAGVQSMLIFMVLYTIDVTGSSPA